jgi:phosphoribosylglycinamide formyltransferase-1
MNIAIFASGKGSNALAIIQYFQNVDNINVKVIVSNNPEAGCANLSENYKIPLIELSKATWQNAPETYIEKLKEAFSIDFVVLAGFLWLVPRPFIVAFPKKILNIHPALLPQFGGKGMYGHHIHKAVLEQQKTESGITIHLVNEEYDKGFILLQAKCNVTLNDSVLSLSLKVQELEHYYYPRAIEFYLNNYDRPQ